MSNTTHNDPLPIDQTPVGELLGDELEARGWSQADFATVIDRPTQFVSEIVTGKKEITRESAAQIGAAFKHSPQYWLNLQDQYYLARQSKNRRMQARLDDVRRRARLNELAPIQLLQKRNILTGSNLDELEAEVVDLFELSSIHDQPEFGVAAAKRANHGEGITMLQKAWVACVRRKARQLPPAKKYLPEMLAKIAASLPRSVKFSGDFATLPEHLFEAGVRLVFVEALPGAKIDGCALFVDGYPVIGLSGRGKRLDKVLFTLLHEIAHILQGHVDDAPIVESIDDSHEHESTIEKEANDAAFNWIFPNGYPPVPSRINAAWIEQTAAKLGLARIVLIGQLQKRGRLDWRTTLAKNAPSVSEELPRWK